MNIELYIIYIYENLGISCMDMDPEGFFGMEILSFVVEEIYTKSKEITFQNNCVKNRKNNE